MKYYIYLHIKITNGEPFYVGKGKDKRCFVKNNRSSYWKNIAKKYDYDIIFLEENISEEEALVKETYWINRIGRKDLKKGLLVNFTDGGEGTSGRPMNQNTKNILSKINTGRPTSDKQKQIVGLRYKNKFGSEHNRSKKVLCIQNNTEYGSMSEAGRELNISTSSVSWSIKHKKPIFGMHFEIKE